MATATAVIPRSRENFTQVDDKGYVRLVEACRQQGVRRFVFVSVPVTPYDDEVPIFRYKRAVERLLQDSGLEYTILRASLFMDDWLALIGSSIPLRGAEAHTLERPFWFSRWFLGAVGHSIERRGVAFVPGSGKARHAFIALDDVARFMVGSLGTPRAANAVWEVGGPEILSWDEAVAVFGRVLGRSIRAVHQPAAVFRAALKLLMPVSPAAANLMGLNYITAVCDTTYDAGQLARDLGISLTSVEAFLRARLAS